MENHNFTWAYDVSENMSSVGLVDCRQYLSPVPEEIAEKLSENPSIPRIMNVLRWNDMTSEELEFALPGLQSHIPLMVEAGLVRSDYGVFSLSEAYYDYPALMDADELYWYLVSEKREWGLFLKDIMESLAMYLIANKFGTSCDSSDIEDLEQRIGEEKMTEAGNRLFGVLASLLTDEDPESLFERWTKEVH